MRIRNTATNIHSLGLGINPLVAATSRASNRDSSHHSATIQLWLEIRIFSGGRHFGNLCQERRASLCSHTHTKHLRKSQLQRAVFFYLMCGKCYKGGQTAILVRCPADYRNVSGLEKIADQCQRTTEIELPLVRC